MKPSTKHRKRRRSSGGRASVLKELQSIPGVGPSIAQDLWNLGFRSVQQLKGKDPERMYRRSCTLQGAPVDRCLLYVYRCAVNFASRTNHDPKLLNWWNWSDEALEHRRVGKRPLNRSRR